MQYITACTALGYLFSNTLVPYTQVFRDGSGMMGIVDYAAKDDMKYALRKLDDTEFKVCPESNRDHNHLSMQ